MSFDKDNLFDFEQVVLDFQFDERVVSVFPDMIYRSIPNYAGLLQLISVLSQNFLQDKTSTVYDLGASLGAASLAVLKTCPKAKIIAVDNSLAMHKRLSDYLLGAGIGNIKAVCADILTIDFEIADLFLLNFVMQFIDLNKRDFLLNKIYQSLNKGGVVFLSEKTKSNNSLLIKLHENFKKNNGYSELAISQKRESLEKVMLIEDTKTIINRAEKIGFSVVPFFQSLMFCGFILQK